MTALVLRPGGPVTPWRGRLTEYQTKEIPMLKNLINTLRGKSEPIVWWGRDRDIWPDPDAPDYGWYCGTCGHNRGGLAELEAEGAADDHARTHTGVTVKRIG